MSALHTYSATDDSEGHFPADDGRAMSKDESPWAETDSAEAAPAERATAPADQARAAANPWLVPQDDTPPQRRSAAIEDLLRPRRAGPAWLRRGLPGGWLVWLVATVTFSGLLASSLHTIKQGEAGLVSTLGRYDRTLGPGLGATLPWPLETVQTYPIGTPQVLTFPDQGGGGMMPTRDGQLLDLGFKLRWTIADPRAFAGALTAPEAALRDLAEAEMRAAIAEESFDPVWDGSARAAVAQRVRARCQAVLDAWHAGVRIEAIEIDQANPPAQLAETFAKVANARSESRDHREKAEEWSARTLNNARAEAQDFDRIYQQYLAAPEITRRRMYYETMERVIANNAHVIVGGNAATQVVMPPAKEAGAPAAPAQPAPAAAKGGQ